MLGQDVRPGELLGDLPLLDLAAAVLTPVVRVLLDVLALDLEDVVEDRDLQLLGIIVVGGQDELNQKP